MTMIYRFVLTMTFFLSLIVSHAPAQSSATLQGMITDQKGEPIANATVVVRDRNTAVERMTQGDDKGNFQVSALPAGNYEVEIGASGFRKLVVKDLPLEVSKSVSRNFQLEPGVEKETVTKSAQPVAIETASISVGRVIDEKRVQDIPLNGRHFIDLGQLIPGSVTPPQDGVLAAPQRGQGSFSFNTAGAREDTVNFMINGINLNDLAQNQIAFQPSISTVREFKVDNSTFSAESGLNSGAIVNIASRSGANQFHGEAYEFLRNDAFDARNFFEVTKGPFKRNQFGEVLSGPILKDRTFFLFGYEGVVQRQGFPIDTQVPSASERSQILNDRNTSPTARRLLAFIPPANFGDVGFRGASPAPIRTDQWTVDILHTLTSNDRLHAYYAIQRDTRIEPTLRGNTIPNFGDRQQSRRQIFTLNQTHTFGPDFVNEARFGFNRLFFTLAPNRRINPSDLGIQVGVNEPIGLPEISIASLGLDFGGPSNLPQRQGDTTFVLSDTASSRLGRHGLKFGGEFRRFYNNNMQKDTGFFNFDDVESFGRGTASNFAITLGDRASSISTGTLGFFLQDSYRWRPNFTLELGLRYDWFMAPTERFNRFVIFDPGTASLVQVGAGVNRVYRASNKNWQPRLGFAWDPFKDGKTSIRAAYAISSNQPITSLLMGVSSNPPLNLPLSFQGRIRFDNAIAVAERAGLAPFTIDQGFDSSYVQSWNFNIQREIIPTLGVMVGYFGSKGTHLQIARNMNQFVDGVRPFGRLSPNSALLPGTRLENITQIGSGGNSNYNALWAGVDKRFSNGFQFNASYSWSKSIDYNSLSSQSVTVQDSSNIRNDRGLSDFDARHRFVIDWVYELPFSGNRWIEGWEISGITQLQSGNPVNMVTSNSTFTGTPNTLRPDLVGTITLFNRPDLWFSNTVCDPAARRGCDAGTTFAVPNTLVDDRRVFHFGNLGRNVVIGPKFTNVDVSVLKRTRITESVNLQFRVEVFDLFNHANFGQPGSLVQVGSLGLGRIFNTRFLSGDSGSSRQIQFGVKLLF